MNVLHSSDECDHSKYTLFSPRGWATPESLGMMMDANAHLVWAASGFDQIYNVMVQEYKGEKYITFWGGDDGVGGHGEGFYYMASLLLQNLHVVGKVQPQYSNGFIG